MKRREFLAATSGAAGCLLPAWPGVNAAPCPPPTVSIAGGAAVTTSCSPSAGPAWFNAMSVNTWAQPTSNTLDSVQFKPMIDPGGYSGLALSGILAYSGGLVDNARREFLMIADGGHSDYVGNEGYALALWADSPYWYRLNDPTPARFIWQGVAQNSNIVDGTTRFLDGRSTSMHTYGIPQYANGRVWFPAQGHTTGGSGSWVNGIVSYDRLQSGIPLSHATSPVAHPGVPDAGPWAFWGGFNNSPDTLDSAASGSWNCAYAVTDSAGTVWMLNPQSSDVQYLRLNTANGSHACYNQRVQGGGNPPYGTRWYNTYVPDRAIKGAGNGVISYFHKGASDKIFLFSVPLMGRPSSKAVWTERSTTGTLPTFNGSDYTGTGYAVYYNGAIYFMDWSLHGSTIFRLPLPASLETDALVWETLQNTAGVVPALTGGARSYGRFNIVVMPGGAAVVCVNSTTARPWIYRLP